MGLASFNRQRRQASESKAADKQPEEKEAQSEAKKRKYTRRAKQ